MPGTRTGDPIKIISGAVQRIGLCVSPCWFAGTGHLIDVGDSAAEENLVSPSRSRKALQETPVRCPATSTKAT